MQASGTFKVNLQPLEPCAAGQAGLNLGRLSVDKTFSGALQSSSRGEMLSAVSAVALGGVAGYVAPEQVSGTLAGLTGEMTIRRPGGGHIYRLEYTLPKK